MPKTNIQESDVDTLVPDTQVRREFGGVSDMCLWRWTHDPTFGFPPVIRIKNRCYRSRRASADEVRNLARGWPRTRMTKRDARRAGHDDDEDRQLREGETLHVPMSLMDAFRRHPMHAVIRDACDARAAAAERVKAFDEYVERTLNAWRGPGTAATIPVAGAADDADPREAAYADYCNFIMNGWRNR